VRPLAFPLLAAALLPRPAAACAWGAEGRPGRGGGPGDIIGATGAEAILGRTDFSEGYGKASVAPELAQRWGAIGAPCTLVAVFGSWCGDSHRWIPEAVRLAESPNPFISVHWIGVPRSKKAGKGDWPAQTVPQKTKRVPTFWLFAPAPGGGVRLAGSIVENPPRAGQGMAEALVELLESAL